jgi:hypothetical protein
VLDEMLEDRRVRTLGKRRIVHDASNRTFRDLDPHVAVELRDMDVSPGGPAAKLEIVLPSGYSISPSPAALTVRPVEFKEPRHPAEGSPRFRAAPSGT